MSSSTISPSTTSAATATLPGRPLSLRAELRRQLSRRRTLWSFVLLLALPLVIVAYLIVWRIPKAWAFVTAAT